MVVAGFGSLGLVVGDSTLAFAEAKGNDPILGELTDQLLAAVARMQKTPNGEAGRQIAACLKLLASWGKVHEVDDRLRRSLRGPAAERRRRELLASPPDVDAELTLRGWTLPPGIGGGVTPADLSDTLDDLRRHGITGHWEDQAHAFEAAAAELDRRSRGASLVALQSGTDCSGASFMAAMLETQLALACLVMIWMPELCTIATGIALAWRWYMWSIGC